jgi:hypothetical protein
MDVDIEHRRKLGDVGVLSDADWRSKREECDEACQPLERDAIGKRREHGESP